MAAYAALVSVMQIIDQLERHPSPPISINKQQVESLTEIVTLLQEFLEDYNSPIAYSDEADPLEMRIADAAYAAEDVIESYMGDVVQLRRSTCTLHPSWSSFFNCFRGYNCFGQDLQKVIEDMDLIKKTVMEMMREKSNIRLRIASVKVLLSSWGGINHERGTRGYVAPEWYQKQAVTVKEDVYSFGVMLIDIICCKRSVDWKRGDDEAVLEHWVYNCYTVG